MIRLWTVVCLLYFVRSIPQKQMIKHESEAFICPSASGLFADPETCNRFYSCVDLFPYRSYCPSGLHFDDILKYCTFKKEAKCGPVSTTQSPRTTSDPLAAKVCNESACKLPDCFCSKDGTKIPKGLKPNEIPQMILLTFDESVNYLNFNKFLTIFNPIRKNPNGCNIRGTFFLSHQYNNYQMIEELYADGHEIAVKSITNRQGLEKSSSEEWFEEMNGMKEIMEHFSNIEPNDITGIRSPHLKPGFDQQYEMMNNSDFLYDSSLSVSPLTVPIWPYTLDFKIPHECRTATCPLRSFPGIWELPLNAHYTQDFEGGYCFYLDQCVLHTLDEDDIAEWLKEDFSRHYHKNRAPFIMSFHTNWFQSKNLENGFLKFIDWALQQ